MKLCMVKQLLALFFVARQTPLPRSAYRASLEALGARLPDESADEPTEKEAAPSEEERRREENAAWPERRRGVQRYAHSSVPTKLAAGWFPAVDGGSIPPASIASMRKSPGGQDLENIP